MKLSEALTVYSEWWISYDFTGPAEYFLYHGFTGKTYVSAANHWNDVRKYWEEAIDSCTDKNDAKSWCLLFEAEYQKDVESSNDIAEQHAEDVLAAIEYLATH